MPLLGAEPNLCPTDLFQEPELLPCADRVWWVLHCRPRQEKGVARRLFLENIPFYLPIISKRLLYQGRVKKSRIPLFPGYVFLFGDRTERLGALATSRVVRVLEVSNQEKFYLDLRQIHELIETGLPITPEDKLGPGMRVEICSGAMAGLKGKILRNGSGRRFVVEVDFIQKGASVILDDFLLKPDDDVRELG